MTQGGDLSDFLPYHSLLLPSHQQGELLTKQKASINISTTLLLLCQLQVLIFQYFVLSIDKAKLKSNIITRPSISELSSCLDAIRRSLTDPDSCRSIWSSQLQSISPNELTTTCKMFLASYCSHSLELPPNQTISVAKIHFEELTGTGLYPVSHLVSIQVNYPLCREQMQITCQLH